MTPPIERLHALVTEVVAAHGLDSRRCYAAVRALPPDGARVVVECSDGGVLADVESRAVDAPGVEFHRLPDASLSGGAALVAASSVGDVRREPAHTAELVSQIIYGDSVEPLTREGDWVLARLDDGYIGWIRSWHLAELPRDEASRFEALSKHRIATNHADLLREPSPGALPVTDLVVGTRVRVGAGGRRGWRSATLPDGKSGYVRAGCVEPVPASPGPFGERLAATALRFLGIPYLWGGTTPKGFDCSGLIQRVFRLHGIVLPRDSDLQAEVGSLREGGLGAQQAGDLMFFGASGRPITHVGLVIPGGLFVHAYGQVRVGSLEPVHPSYEANLHKIWRFSRDPLGDEAQGS